MLSNSFQFRLRSGSNHFIRDPVLRNGSLLLLLDIFGLTMILGKRGLFCEINEWLS